MLFQHPGKTAPHTEWRCYSIRINTPEADKNALYIVVKTSWHLLICVVACLFWSQQQDHKVLCPNQSLSFRKSGRNIEILEYLCPEPVQVVPEFPVPDTNIQEFQCTGLISGNVGIGLDRRSCDLAADSKKVMLQRKLVSAKTC